MDNPLSNLALDFWYKVVLAVGVVVFLLSLTFELKGVSNSIALLISLGASFIGLGEWVNHPKSTSIVPPNDTYPGYMQIEHHKRKNTLLGNLFLILGLALVGYGIYRALIE